MEVIYEGQTFTVPDGTPPAQYLQVITEQQSQKWPKAAHKKGELPPAPQRPAKEAGRPEGPYPGGSWIIPPNVREKQKQDALKLYSHEFSPSERAEYAEALKKNLRVPGLFGEQRDIMKLELQTMQALMNPKD